MSLVCNIAYRKKKKAEPVADIDYLVFSSDNDFSVTLGTAGTKTWDGMLEVSTDGTLWSSVADGGETYIGNANQRVYYRGSNNTHITIYNASGNYNGFVLLGTSISCDGNIETLLDYATVQNGGHPTMANDCYIGLFKDNANLISAPSLPATEMVQSAYEEMFRSCTALTTAPELPATTLAVQCYRNMFAYCSSLTNVMTILPATVSADGCYIGLFYHCTSIMQAPGIALTSASYGSCAEMFKGCTALTMVPALKATTLGQQCYYGMFEDCTALQAIPELPATVLADNCYMNMFKSCPEYLFATRPVEDCSVPVTSYVTSSSLQGSHAFDYNGTQYDYPTTTFYTHALVKTDDTLVTSAEYPVAWMYFISEQAITLQLEYATTVSISGKIHYSKNNGKTWNTLGTSHISIDANTKLYINAINITAYSTGGASGEYTHFVGSSGVEFECYGNIEALLDWQTVVSGNHPTLGEFAFEKLFYNTKIKIAPTLSPPTLSRYCYSSMFWGCTSLIEVPNLPALKIASSAYENMFSGCISLVKAPLILANEVDGYGCCRMFYNCTSLVIPPCLPSNFTLHSYSNYESMFEGCKALAVLPALPARRIDIHAYRNMFRGCSSLSVTAQTDNTHQIPYTIPYQNTLYGSIGTDALENMFQFNTSDTTSSTNTPSPETTYYVYSVIEPDGTILTSEPEPAHIYGVSWDGTSITKKWTRTDEATDFADPVPYVLGATKYGSPFDDLYPWKDMTIVEDNDAGTMVKIPKFWYKLTQNGAGMSIQIADKEVEGYSVCPACMDRGDGNGERDYILFGRYHCASSTYKSKTGELPAASATRANFRSNIQLRGTGIYMADWAARFTIWLLYLVEFANWDSQTTIGCGCGNNSSTENMGYTDSMPYHTGTTQFSRTTYGLGTQYRNIEGLWDNVKDFVDGCYNSSAGLNIILDPTKFSDSENGISVGTPTSYRPAAFSVKTIENTFPLFIPSADGSTSIDDWYFGSNFPIVLAGGNYYYGREVGMFYFGQGRLTYSQPSVGSRPMKLPNFTNN